MNTMCETDVEFQCKLFCSFLNITYLCHMILHYQSPKQPIIMKKYSSKRFIPIKYMMLLSVFVCIILSCNNMPSCNNAKEIVCQCVIFPIGTIEDTYQICVYEDSTIRTTYGRRTLECDSCLLNNISLLNRTIIDEIDLDTIRSLSENEMENIKFQLNDLDSAGTVYEDVFNGYSDAWGCAVTIRDKQFIFYMGNSMRQHIRQIEKSSPITLKMRSFA